jgi:hypothetical protein
VTVAEIDGTAAAARDGGDRSCNSSFVVTNCPLLIAAEQVLTRLRASLSREVT